MARLYYSRSLRSAQSRKWVPSFVVAVAGSCVMRANMWRIALMDGYQVVFEHEVLFRDLDAMRHVNNVAFVAFMEDARMQYWKALRKVEGLKDINFILAEVSCRYLSPAHLGETIRIGIRARNLSNKSFQFEYRMEDKASGRLITEGKSVQVMYDYKQKQTMPLEQKMRDAVASLEKLTLEELSSPANS